MPRRAAGVGLALAQIQRQALALLVNLRKEIAARESELQRLKAEESRLGGLVGKPAARAGRPARRAGRTGRVNWRSVLSELPKQFKASDVRAVRGLKAKRASEIFAAITRWIEAGSVRRKARGLYERT